MTGKRELIHNQLLTGDGSSSQPVDNQEENRKRKTTYLYLPKQGSTNISIFDIQQKQLKTTELAFAIPSAPGFCHIQSELYLAGGQDG